MAMYLLILNNERCVEQRSKLVIYLADSREERCMRHLDQIGSMLITDEQRRKWQRLFYVATHTNFPGQLQKIVAMNNAEQKKKSNETQRVFQCTRISQRNIREINRRPKEK